MAADHYNADSFTTFFKGWLRRQQQYLDELLSAADGGDLGGLIARILCHYEEYYEKKSQIAQTDIFLVFSPNWLTTYERSLLWIGGFRPGLIFRLVNDSIHDMSDDQALRIRRLKDDVKVEEWMLNDELAKLQERVAAPPWLEFFRRRGNNGVTGEMKTAFRSVMASADFLRRETALKVVEILSPSQTVRFWGAVAELQLRIRACGLQRDGEKPGPT